MVCMIAFAANEPSKSQRLIGEIWEVGISFCATYWKSRKQSVELESTRVKNLRTEEVFLDSLETEISVISSIVRDFS